MYRRIDILYLKMKATSQYQRGKTLKQGVGLPGSTHATNVIWIHSYCLQIARNVHTRLLLIAIINIPCSFLNTANTIVLKKLIYMYISENSKVEIRFWNIYLKTYVSLSKQQNNVNWASCKLASAWASLSIYKVLAIQVWLMCWFAADWFFYRLYS